jgi:uncharacterized protein (DUF433 family)
MAPKAPDEATLLTRITTNPAIFQGKPIIRGRRLAVEHVLAMLAAGDTPDDLLKAYPWLERDDVLACLAYARRVVGHERVDPALSA